MSYLAVQQLLMQIVWFSCVGGAALGFPWLGTVVGLAFVTFHLARSGEGARNELALVLTAGALGTVGDILLISTGAIVYASGSWIAGLGPHWMIVLWMAFGATLNVAYRWLHGRYLLAALVGGVFGPLSYWAGWRLGGVAFPASLEHGLTALALLWAVSLPALVFVAARLATPPPAAKQPIPVPLVDR